MVMVSTKNIFLFYFGYAHHLLNLTINTLASSSGFESQMCFEQTIQIHALLEQRVCPYEVINADAEYNDCSLWCKGKYFIVNLHVIGHSCVGYTIIFNNGMQSSELKSFFCNIPSCLLEQLTFECTFVKNKTEIKSNKKSSDGNYQQNQQNMSAGNISCLESDTGAVIGLSCAFVGGVLGVICFFVLGKYFRTHQQRFSPSKFNHSNTDDCCKIPIERERMIAGQAAKETIIVEDKAIQVSCHRENNSFEPRLEENKLYQFRLMNDQPEAYGMFCFLVISFKKVKLTK